MARPTPKRANPTRVRKRRWRLTPRFWAILFGGLAVYVFFAYWVGYAKIRSLRQQIAEVEHQIQAMQMRNQQLRDEIERVQSDAYTERVAREKLGLVKPGETPFVVAKPVAPDDPFSVERRSQEGDNATRREGW